jgi:hypothetical protein
LFSHAAARPTRGTRDRAETAGTTEPFAPLPNSEPRTRAAQASQLERPRALAYRGSL